MGQYNPPSLHSRPDIPQVNILVTMRSLSLGLVLGLVSLSLASIPANMLLEDLEDQVHRNPEMFQHHEDFKAFDSKRVSDGFWSKFLDKLHEEKRGKYYGGNNYADAVFRGLG